MKPQPLSGWLNQIQALVRVQALHPNELKEN